MRLIVVESLPNLGLGVSLISNGKFAKWQTIAAFLALAISIFSIALQVYVYYQQEQRIEELTYLGSANIAARQVVPEVVPTVVNVTDPAGDLLPATHLKLTIVSRSSFMIVFYPSVVDAAASMVQVNDKPYGFERFCNATFAREREADPPAWEAEPSTLNLGPYGNQTIYVYVVVNKMRFSDAVGISFDNFSGTMHFVIMFKLTQARSQRTLDHSTYWFDWSIAQGRASIFSGAGAPATFSLSPTAGPAGTTVFAAGENYDGTTCTLSSSPSGLFTSSSCAISGGTLSGGFTVASSATPGSYVVTVTTDISSETKAAAFVVPAPTLILSPLGFAARTSLRTDSASTFSKRASDLH